VDSLTRKPARTAPGDMKDPGRRPPAANYSKQMQGKTHMVVTLTDGEQLEGLIEWYDRDCLKLNRTGAPNLLVYKHCIKYMYKADPE